MTSQSDALHAMTSNRDGNGDLPWLVLPFIE
jgi:hypothetical protein